MLRDIRSYADTEIRGEALDTEHYSYTEMLSDLPAAEDDSLPFCVFSIASSDDLTISPSDSKRISPD